MLQILKLLYKGNILFWLVFESSKIYSMVIYFFHPKLSVRCNTIFATKFRETKRPGVPKRERIQIWVTNFHLKGDLSTSWQREPKYLWFVGKSWQRMIPILFGLSGPMLRACRSRSDRDILLSCYWLRFQHLPMREFRNQGQRHISSVFIKNTGMCLHTHTIIYAFVLKSKFWDPHAFQL